MSSIALPALGLRPVEQPNLLGEAGQAVQLGNLLQARQFQQQNQPLQIQAQQQENQQREVALKDQAAQTAAMKDWDGKNLQDLPGLLLKHGGSATAVFGMKKQLLDQQEQLTKLDTDTLANQAKKNDYLLGSLQAATSGPDEGLSDRVNAAALDAVKKGYLDQQHAQGIQQLTQQIQDPKALRDQLGTMEKSFMGQQEQFTQEQKKRETAASELKAQTDADRLAFEKQGGMSVDKQELNSYLKNNPGKTPQDFAAWKAKQAPLANFNLQMSAGGGLTKEALDQQAENYYSTGKLPPGGRGAAGVAQNRAIMNRAAELHSGQSLAEGSAEYAANKESLKKLQTNFDNVSAFESTAIKNLDQVAQAGAKIPDLGARFANVPVRMISEKMIGTPEMARFKTALLTAQTEAAKVLSSANASGVLSDSARHETQEILDGNLSFPAMMASINQLKTDFGNRHESYADQITDIKRRIGGKAAPAPTANQSSGLMYARDPQGKLHSAPAGTTLPAGWKQEQNP